MARIGGSLLRAGREPLCALLGALAQVHTGVLVVPGGGVFDARVRHEAARLRLGDTAAHWMAVLAMDAYGWLLADLLDIAQPVTDPAEARRVAAQRRLPVLLPFSLLRARDDLPHSWDVTSDSIAAWVAAVCGASALILLKDVDGVYPADPLRERDLALLDHVDAGEAARLGVVDAYFPRALARFFGGGECWVLNGLCPERVSGLLRGEIPRGTRVRCSPAGA
ncbi:MAG: hypothetical protein QN178_16810 [Armatimonadota bacterium]|nr:hypothetical protein [Armatimonadota bacterium]